MLIGSIDSLPPSPAPAREGVTVLGTAAPAAPATPAVAAGAVVSPEAVHQAVVQANAALRSVSQALEFEYDRDANVTVVRLVDTVDHRVLRQIPSPEMLEISRALEKMQTMLVRGKA